jgi:hypothetical protein
MCVVLGHSGAQWWALHPIRMEASSDLLVSKQGKQEQKVFENTQNKVQRVDI